MLEAKQEKTTARRSPQQSRSQERVNKILDAAAQEFAEVGYEAATTNAIAARAQTSIGSLYRFFPDKTAIFRALADRLSEQMQALLSQIFTSEATSLPLTKVVSQMIDSFDDLFAKNPAMRTIYIQSLFSPEIVEINQKLSEQGVQQLVSFCLHRNPKLSNEQCQLIALTIVRAVSPLLDLAWSRDEAFRKQLISETKKLMLGYLQPYLPE